MTEHPVEVGVHSGINRAAAAAGGGGGTTLKQVSFSNLKEDEERSNNDENETRNENTKGTTDLKSATIGSSSWRGGSSSSSRSNPSISTGSSGSAGSSSTTSAAADYVRVGSTRSQASSSIPSLGERLIRTQKHRDPLRYYDVIEQLGSGSMGDVCKVRKRTFGGSARQSFVEREKKAHSNNNCWPCFSIFCFPGRHNDNNSQRNHSSATSSSSLFVSIESSSSSSSSSNNNNSNITSNILSERTKKQRQYARSKQTSSMISYGSQVKVDFALKTIVLDQCGNETLRQELVHEINILRSLDHPNIVRALESYDYQNRLFLVLELCNGGTLYERDPYTESQAKNIVYTLLDAIAYLHSKNITHRDLKYENIMFASPTSDTIKIIDFGLSKKYGKKKISNNSNTTDNPQHKEQDGNDTTMMKEFVGTIYTMAPEVIRGIYNEKCDVWSIGVLAFMLLSSSVPFWADTDKNVMRKILRNTWEFDNVERWNHISLEAKNFIRSIFTKEADQRPSATKAMEDPWFQQKPQGKQQPLGMDQKSNEGDEDFVVLPTSSSSSSPMMSWTVMDRVHATIQSFAGYSRLKKLALLVIAHQSIDEEIGFLRRLFLQRFDTQKSNPNVSYEEFKVALRGGGSEGKNTDDDDDHKTYNYNYSDDELWNMFTGMDVDGTGKVSFTEFLAATIEAHGSIEEERIAEAFDRIDCDDSGYITVNNLRDVLGDEVDDVFIDELIKEVKPSQEYEDDDRRIITYEDFLGLWDSKGDETLRLNLLEVQQRRRTNKTAGGGSASSSSSSSIPVVGSTTALAGKNITAMVSRGQANHAEEGTEIGTTSGQYFFEQEKAKSIRGVWI